VGGHGIRDAPRREIGKMRQGDERRGEGVDIMIRKERGREGRE
jgi:hypothetical protein